MHTAIFGAKPSDEATSWQTEKQNEKTKEEQKKNAHTLELCDCFNFHLKYVREFFVSKNLRVKSIRRIYRIEFSEPLFPSAALNQHYSHHTLDGIEHLNYEHHTLNANDDQVRLSEQRENWHVIRTKWTPFCSCKKKASRITLNQSGKVHRMLHEHRKKQDFHSFLRFTNMSRQPPSWYLLLVFLWVLTFFGIVHPFLWKFTFDFRHDFV